MDSPIDDVEGDGSSDTDAPDEEGRSLWEWLEADTFNGVDTSMWPRLHGGTLEEPYAAGPWGLVPFPPVPVSIPPYHPPFINGVPPFMNTTAITVVPFQTTPSPPCTESLLGREIVREIDSLFSEENLSDDRYLRYIMDPQGWVHLEDIALFPVVRRMTTDVHFIASCLMRNSSVVEVNNRMVRRRPL